MRPAQIRLAPEYQCSPLWDHATGEPVDLERLALSPELLNRLARWDGVFQATYDPDDPASSGFADVGQERDWVSEGEEIALCIKREWPGEVIAQLSMLDFWLREGARQISPERRDEIGRMCRIAEIRAAIDRLDALSRERDALPQWDGDTQDDIAAAQQGLSRILAHAQPRYFEDVAHGLASPQPFTRAYVAMALGGHEASRALPTLRGALAGEKDDLVQKIMSMVLAELKGRSS